MTDFIDYENIVEQSLRQVVKLALQHIIVNGLHGDHQMYISFETTHPEAKVSENLILQHPKEMTIVIQHQFWDLNVYEDFFEITLSFNKIPEKLVIPYSSIINFADPSVKFALNFKKPKEVSVKQSDIDEETISEKSSDEKNENIINLSNFRDKKI